MRSPLVLGGSLAVAVTLAAAVGAHYEGMVPHSYADPIGIPTGCLGDTLHPRWIDSHTMAECVAQYHGRLAGVIGTLGARCIGRPLTAPQWASLASFASNTGIGATCGSTMVRMIDAGAPASQWCDQMPRWHYVHIAGIATSLRGLVRRRASERRLCLGDTREALAWEIAQ